MLALEMFKRSQRPRHNLLVLNFLKNYLYESRYKYQLFEVGGKIEKDNALKILSKFNITNINTAWLITHRTENEGVQTQSIYGDMNVPVISL